MTEQTYEWEEMSMLGKWSKVTGPEPPVTHKGRLKTAEGQGARVRGVRKIDAPKEPSPGP
jgi:hypothetical protein